MHQQSAADRNRLLVKNIFWNFFGLGSPILIGLFTIPCLLHALGTLRFGLLTIIWMFISYSSLLDLGLGKVLTQQLSIKMVHADHKACANLVWTSVVLLSLLGAIIGAIFYLLTPWVVAHFLHVPSGDTQDCIQAFYLLAYSIPFVVATNCARGVLESHQAFGVVNVVRIVMGMFVFLGPLAAIAIHNSLALITLFLMGGKIVNCFLYFYACYRVTPELFQKFDIVLHDLLQILRLGSWLTVSNVLNPLIGYLDRFFIAGVSLGAVAYYVTPNEMVTKLWLIPSAITAVVFPEFSGSLIKDLPRARLLYQRSMKTIFLLLFPIVFVLIYFASDLLTLWLGQDFAQHSYRILQWLALGVFINSMAHIPVTLIMAKGDMHLTGLLAIIEFPLYGCALWLATRYGNIETVAIVWVIRMVIDTAIILLLANRTMKFVISKKLFWSVNLLLGVLIFGLYSQNLLFELVFAIFVIIVLLNVGISRIKSVFFKVTSQVEKGS